jgi:hypothetical protein
MLTPGAYDPRFMKPATLCRCGHLLAACADCRDWLSDHAPRIAAAWEWWWIKALELGVGLGQEWGADAAEADDLAYYLASV